MQIIHLVNFIGHIGWLADQVSTVSTVRVPLVLLLPSQPATSFSPRPAPRGARRGAALRSVAVLSAWGNGATFQLVAGRTVPGL